MYSGYETNHETQQQTQQEWRTRDRGTGPSDRPSRCKTRLTVQWITGGPSVGSAGLSLG